MYHDKFHQSLVTVVKQKTLFLIQYWNLPELTPQKEFCCSSLMTSFARIVLTNAYILNI